MKQNNVLFIKLLEYYSSILTRLEINNQLYQIGGKFSYYYADENKLHMYVQNLIEIDIKSAFPTICNVWFTGSKFIERLNSIEDKFEKNRYMTNYLKKMEEGDGNNYLIDLNNYTKISIFAYVLNNWADVNVIEYKKDSLLFSGDNQSQYIKEIDEIFKSTNMIFHKKNYDHYIRLDGTSFYITPDDEFIIKGKWKDIPDYLKNLLHNIIKKQYSNDFLKYYNRHYYELTKDFPEHDDYFKVGNKKVSFDKLLEELIYPMIFLSK